MAAITLGVDNGNTNDTNIYVTDAFTPAADDLLLALVGCQGTVDAGEYLSSDAGKTYSKIDSGTWSGGGRQAYAFVADQLAAAVAQTGTMDVSGDNATGCTQAVLRVSGMSKLGLTAIRQFKLTENVADETIPSVTFDNPCLTDNPTILIVVLNNSLPAFTPPDGWTKIAEPNHITPSCSTTVFVRDSGFTGTTITCNEAASTPHFAMAIELDASGDEEEDVPITHNMAVVASVGRLKTR